MTAPDRRPHADPLVPRRLPGGIQASVRFASVDDYMPPPPGKVWIADLPHEGPFGTSPGLRILAGVADRVPGADRVRVRFQDGSTGEIPISVKVHEIKMWSPAYWRMMLGAGNRAPAR